MSAFENPLLCNTNLTKSFLIDRLNINNSRKVVENKIQKLKVGKDKCFENQLLDNT